MSKWTKEMVEEAISKLTDQASSDEDFRELCKLSIHGAIKEVTGHEVPLSARINVIDNTGYDIVVILPPFRRQDEELDNSELEQVAGGSKDFNMKLEGQW